MRSYFGQSYESSFLAGALAGLISKNGNVGYVGTGAGLEKVSRANGFIQGLRMIHPGCRIPLVWNNFWDYPEYSSELSEKMFNQGVELIYQHSNPRPGDDSGRFGLYDYDKSGNIRHYGETYWNWGEYYLALLRNLISGSKGYFLGKTNEKTLHFWGGLRSGVVDLKINKELVTRQTLHMMRVLRKSLIEGDTRPFESPVYDNKGQLRINEEEKIDLDGIREMNWLAEGLDEISL